MSLPQNFPVRRLFRVVNGGTPRADPANWDGDIPWVTPADLSKVDGGSIAGTERTLTSEGLSAGSRAVPRGSLILSSRAPIGYVAQTTATTAFNQGCKGLVPVSEIDLRFFRYQLVAATAKLEALGQGSTFVELRGDDLASMKLFAPPRPDQHAIADYLDRETARIDALIAAKRRMVELLEERLRARQVLTVLGDLEATSHKASRSGIYGTVPDTWIETPLRHLGCSVQTGPFGSQLHADEYVTDGWPVVNPMNLSGGKITATAAMMISDEKRAELARHTLREGDIVFGRRGELGRAGLVGPKEAGWLCGTGSLRLRLSGTRLSPAYLKLVLETPPARAYFQLCSVGSTMDNLNGEIVLAFPTLVPPPDVQRRVVAAVALEERRVARLRMTLSSQLDLLQEHRQALITAAVTGQLDIPEAA